MSLLREIPPTAGWPIKPGDLFSSVFKTHAPNLLEAEFKKYLNSFSCILSYSGTSSFYIILETLKKLSPKKTVVIPAFICPLIPLAVKKAGLNLKVCDTNPSDFDFDLNELEKICSSEKDILAILTLHLGGLPADFFRIKEIAKRHNAFIVEDCAQSMGARYKTALTGSLGDFSFFSLCRGKGLTIYEGGLALANKADYAPVLESTAEEIIKPGLVSEALKIAEIFAYSLFYRPGLFWFAYRLPQLYWELRKNPERAMAEYFGPDFPVHKVSAFRNFIGYINFPNLEKNIGAQRKKAQIYLEQLKGTNTIRPLVESAGDLASYPYLTLLFAESKMRDRAILSLKNSGLGVSRIYLKPVTGYEYLRKAVPQNPCLNAQGLSEKTMTLSTSIYLKESEQVSLVETLKKAVK